MNRIRPALIFGAVLLVSVGCSGFGLWMLRDGAAHSHPRETECSLYYLFGGMTVVPVILTLLVNLIFPSERVRLRHRPDRTRSPIRIKRLERNLKRLHFMRKHPSAVLAFILAALAVLGIGTFAPATEHELHQALGRRLLCAICGVAYLVMLVGFLYAWLSHRWESYLDVSIRQIEGRVAQAKSLEGQPPA